MNKCMNRWVNSYFKLIGSACAVSAVSLSSKSCRPDDGAMVCIRSIDWRHQRDCAMGNRASPAGLVFQHALECQRGLRFTDQHRRHSVQSGRNHGGRPLGTIRGASDVTAARRVSFPVWERLPAVNVKKAVIFQVVFCVRRHRAKSCIGGCGGLPLTWRRIALSCFLV